MRPVEKLRAIAELEESPGYRVAVVGGTGVVGREMISQLESREFPVRELVIFASARSAGDRVAFKGTELTVRTLSHKNIRGFDLALFSSGNDVSREWAPRFAADGCMVVDNSSEWRMHPKVPLVAAGVNDEALDDLDRPRQVGAITEALEERGLAWRLLATPDGQYWLDVQEPPSA